MQKSAFASLFQFDFLFRFQNFAFLILHFAFLITFDPTIGSRFSGLKGKPVKNRCYPRSCKLQITIHL